MSGSAGSRLKAGLLAGLFATGACGQYLLRVQVGPFTVYAYRAAVLLVAGLFLWSRGWRAVLGVFQEGMARRLAVVLVVWATWGLASVAWSPDPLNGLREMVELGFAALLFAGMCLLVDPADRAQGPLRRAWAAAVACASLVAAWELATGQHLKSPFIDAAPSWIADGLLTLSTFGNPNNFASFLLLALPFAAWSAERASGWPGKAAGLAALAWMVFLIVATGSRLCLAGAAALGVFWAAGSFTGRARVLAVAGLLLAVAAAAAGLALARPLVAMKLLSAQWELGGQATGSSGNIRIHLYLDALYFALSSFGAGIGAGGFRQRMACGYLPWGTEGITAPHNFFLEILSQYGVAAFAGFLWWMAGLGRSFRDLRRAEARHGPGFWGLGALVAYAFAALANSSFLGQPGNWLFLGSLLAMGRGSARAAGPGPAPAPGVPERPDVVHMTSVHSRDDIRIFHKEAAGLARAGFRVCLAAVGPGDEDVQGVRLLAVPGGTGRPGRIPGAHVLRRALGTGARVALRAWRCGAGIVHYHDPELAPYAFLLKVLGGRTVIKDAHEDLPRQMHSKPYIPAALRRPAAGLAWVLERAACLGADAVVAATPAIAEAMPAGRTVVVQNFPLAGELAAPGCAPLAERPPWAAYVGGITRIRAAGEMVAAMARVSHPGARLELAGPFEPGLRQRLEAQPGMGRVDVLGTLPRAGVAQMLGRCRLGLVLYHPLPNHFDAQPNKLFEYLSAGLPVVASDFPLWRRLVDGVGCGLLVDPRDPAAIAGAVDHLLGHPETAAAMGRRGQEAVRERFNWAAEERKLHALYRRLACR